MRVAYVISMKPLCFLLSPNKKNYAALYPQHNMSASMYHYLLPISYERDYVLYVF